MNEQQLDSLVIDQNGVRGFLDAAKTPDEAKQSGLLLIHIENGRDVLVPATHIVASKAGGYLLSRSFEEFYGTQQTVTNTQAVSQNTGKEYSVEHNAAAQNLGQQITIPVVAEELKIERENVVTGGVRVHKRVVERTEIVDQPIQTEEVKVERVPVNKYVDAAPPVRYEGDTIIIPLVEEVIVTEKRLMLREEIFIHREQFETRKPQEVTVRSEQIELEEISPNESTRGTSAANQS